MGRSYRLPSLGSSAGARFTVMRRLGNSNRELMIALRTRSLLSRTVASGRPTMANLGSPPVIWTSTCTAGASIPTLARLMTVASDIARSGPGDVRNHA